jgi:hypothetical protein
MMKLRKDATEEHLADKVTGLAEQRDAIDRDLASAVEALRMTRISKLRAGEPLGELPFLGDPKRTAILNHERTIAENAAIDRSPEHQRALANLNAENEAA